MNRLAVIVLCCFLVAGCHNKNSHKQENDTVSLPAEDTGKEVNYVMENNVRNPIKTGKADVTPTDTIGTVVNNAISVPVDTISFYAVDSVKK